MIPEPQLAVKPNTTTQINAPLYLGLGLLLVFIMAARSPLDTDMWWHLRAGEWMVETGQPLLQDIFSFTRLEAPWINHSWLAQIILYLIFRGGGMFGLAFFTAALAALSMGLLYPQMTGHPLFKAFLLVLITPVSALVWSPRPQMFSLVMLAATGLLLYRYRQRLTRKIWLLVPIFILWSNLHGGYALGLILIGVVLLGGLLDHLLGYSRKTLTKNEMLHLCGWAVVAWASVIINPNGYNAWLIPFNTVSVTSLQNLISEWASPNFHEIVQWPFILLLLILIFSVGNSRRRMTGIEFLTTAVFTGMALVARRNFGPFALIVGPIITVHLWPVLTEWFERVKARQSGSVFPRAIFAGSPNYSTELTFLQRRWINTLLISLLLIAGLVKLFMVSSPSFLEQVKPEYYPVNAVDWISENTPSGRMLSSYGWGGYLMWHLRDYPVFIDGRTDLYEDDIINEWLSVVQAEDGWKDVLEKWDISLVLVEPERPIVRTLKKNNWIELYQDQTSVLLSK